MQESDRRLISGFIFDILQKCGKSLTADTYTSIEIKCRAKLGQEEDENVYSLLVADPVLEIDGERIELEK